MGKKRSRPLFSYWGFRLGCATMYWAAAFVVLTNGLALFLNLRAGLPLSTDRRLTWVMAGLLLMFAYHNFMGWWPFKRRQELSPEYQRWMEARRRREEAERAAEEAGEGTADLTEPSDEEEPEQPSDETEDSPRTKDDV